jgi:CheY-like chemotaxis protein
MPVMDGFTFLETLKAAPSFSEIPVIILSGVDLDAGQRQRLTELSAGILRKGVFKEDDLFSLLGENCQD